MGHLLDARCCYSQLTAPRQEFPELSPEVGPTILILNLQVKRLRLGTVKELAQGHRARTWRRRMGPQAVLVPRVGGGAGVGRTAVWRGSGPGVWWEMLSGQWEHTCCPDHCLTELPASTELSCIYAVRDGSR